jgi:hypothetical protein
MLLEAKEAEAKASAEALLIAEGEVELRTGTFTEVRAGFHLLFLWTRSVVHCRPMLHIYVCCACLCVGREIEGVSEALLLEGTMKESSMSVVL